MMTPAHCDKSPIIACLECSCHIWVPQLVYFDKIHHDTKKNILFSNAQSDSFRGVGSLIIYPTCIDPLDKHNNLKKIYVQTLQNHATCPQGICVAIKSPTLLIILGWVFL
jgi:hypothetical protein